MGRSGGTGEGLSGVVGRPKVPPHAGGGVVACRVRGSHAPLGSKPGVAKASWREQRGVRGVKGEGGGGAA